MSNYALVTAGLSGDESSRGKMWEILGQDYLLKVGRFAGKIGWVTSEKKHCGVSVYYFGI